jgi:type IV secretion system protein TrbL
MNDLGIIDRFTNVFSQYIDSGFGLLSGEIAFLTATLVAIDITLAGLLWAMDGADDVIAKLLRKTLYVGAFAFIITNFNQLAGIVFRSFAGLGLTATGSDLTEGELLRPGRLASVGVDAARPLLDQIGQLTGFPDVFLNLDTVAVLFLAWLVVIVSFFILAVQLFVTLIEFKLTTLAGFVLVPFALWNKTAFLAERVLGNVVSSGIKVLVLAVIVGIGTGLFGEFTPAPGAEPTIDNALAIMLASLALFGLGLFGPSIATGLVSGAPQLGAGAAAGTALAAGGIAVAGGAAAAGAARLAGGVGGAAMKATGPALRGTGPAVAGGYAAFRTGAMASGAAGTAAVASGLANVARVGGRAIGQGIQSAATRTGQAIRQRLGLSGSATTATPSPGGVPEWAKRMQQRRRASHGLAVATHVTRSTDRGGTGANPTLRERD